MSNLNVLLPEDQIRQLLLLLGFRVHQKGFCYLTKTAALALVMEGFPVGMVADAFHKKPVSIRSVMDKVIYNAWESRAAHSLWAQLFPEQEKCPSCRAMVELLCNWMQSNEVLLVADASRSPRCYTELRTKEGAFIASERDNRPNQ